MFFGSFFHSLDDKGRLVIPRKMREELGTKAYVMKGYDGALSIYKNEAFEQVMAQSATLPFEKKDARAYLRVQLATVSELDVDKSGRVQIPTQLLNQYHIGKDVIVLGVFDHIEVWDKEKYEEYIKSMDENFEDIAEKLKGE
ncbi:MAG: division/cell wall cluster transcriptional repressor MraZ [Bacilli bacterium]|nr:division/cell wall cluster transcriptional repressor MraZ [Bacilli bacterium]